MNKNISNIGNKKVLIIAYPDILLEKKNFYSHNEKSTTIGEDESTRYGTLHRSAPSYHKQSDQEQNKITSPHDDTHAATM